MVTGYITECKNVGKEFGFLKGSSMPFFFLPGRLCMSIWPYKLAEKSSSSYRQQQQQHSCCTTWQTTVPPTDNTSTMAV